VTRVVRVWDALDANQRLAGVAALAIFLTMLLPWYSQTDTVVLGSAARSRLASAQTTLSAFQSFSFVEAAVLLVSAAVLAMLYARARGLPFRLPGGDGAIVMIAGGWAALLIFYRMLDKPGLHGTHRITASVGVEWGIFLALIAALALTLAGSRMRALREPEAPLLRPRTSRPPAGASEQAPLPAGARPRYPPAPATSAPGLPRARQIVSPPTPATVRYPQRGA
jgi:hypothetical protein